MQERIQELFDKTNGFSVDKVLKFIAEEFKGRIAFATSLGEEDQILLDKISKIAPSIEVFTLDTGRLYQETYDLIDKNNKKYSNAPLKVYYPQTEAVEKMVNDKGINLFYESIENRKLCCGIRKIEPLNRALTNVDAWITGLRRSQSITRSAITAFQWDNVHEIIKINPLVDWSLEDVKGYIKDHDVDVSPLHAEGFVSIGCAPCTRAVEKGEDIRAGRWWWEKPEQKECGLHNNPNRPK